MASEIRTELWPKEAALSSEPKCPKKGGDLGQKDRAGKGCK